MDDMAFRLRVLELVDLHANCSGEEYCSLGEELIDLVNEAEGE